MGGDDVGAPLAAGGHDVVTEAEVWEALAEIPDPEIPVISVVDLGVVRDVRVESERVHVEFTPTFLGCPALEVMRREGLRPTRLTNAWVPFVVASTVLVRDGGRVGLVLPAELLQVTYAAPLRDFLLSRFRDITLLTFERLVFDGILQEVVLFCGVRDSGAGQTPARIRTVHLPDAGALADADLGVEWAPALLHENEKWTTYFLDPAAIRLLRVGKIVVSSR